MLAYNDHTATWLLKLRKIERIYRVLSFIYFKLIELKTRYLWNIFITWKYMMHYQKTQINKNVLEFFKKSKCSVVSHE